MPVLVLTWEADVSKPAHLRLAAEVPVPVRQKSYVSPLERGIRRITGERVPTKSVETERLETGYYWHPGGKVQKTLCGLTGVLYDDLQVLDTARLGKSCPGCVQVAAETPGCTGLAALKGTK